MKLGLCKISRNLQNICPKVAVFKQNVQTVFVLFPDPAAGLQGASPDLENQAKWHSHGLDW